MEEQENQNQEQSKEHEKHEDEREVEVLEFSLTGDEIDELVEKLKALKVNKTNVSFDVDENNEFVIHYETAGDVVEEKKPELYEEGKSVEQTSKLAQQIQQNKSEEGQEVPTLDGVERQ